MGMIDNVGNDITFKIINSFTNKIINRSNVRPFNDDKSPNLRAHPLNYPEVVKTLIEDKFKAEEETHTSKPSSN